ncbi:MAG: PAS domain S-box protein [Nitrospiraceae bacterium]|nr:PAS domain S-box protein [Nitrospiraceae bacterium]
MKQKVSKKTLFSSVGSLVVIITIISLAYILQRHFKDIVVSQRLDQLLTTTKTASHGLEEFITGHSAFLKALSKDTSIQKTAYNRETFQSRQKTGCCSESCSLKTLYDIQKSMELEQDHFSISLLDARGVMLCRQPYIKGKIGMDYTDRPGVAHVLKEHRSWVSNVFYNASGNLAISVLQPLFYRDKFVGILRWMTEVDTISKSFVQSIKVGQTGYAWMINDRGTILSYPQREFIGRPITDLIKKGASDKGLSFDRAGIKGLIRKRYGYIEQLKTKKGGYGIYKDCLSDKDELVAFKTVSLGKTDWHLIIALPYSEIAGPINDHGYHILGLVLGLILFFGVGGLVLCRIRKRQAQIETETKYLKEIARSAEALKESEAKYRSLFEDSRDAIYIIDTKKGKFIDMNQSALDLLGYTREEMIGMDVQGIYLNPDDMSVFQQEIEQKGSVRDYEVKIRKKDGTQMDCLLTSSVRKESDGRILGYQGIIRDVTQRKQHKKKLKRQAQIIDQVHDGVIFIDLNGYITYWNKGAERLYGYAEKEVLGRHISFVLPEDQGKSLQQIESIKKGEIQELELELKRKSGETFYALISFSLVKNGDDSLTGIIAYTMDITKRRHLEAQIRQAQKMEAIGTLTGGIAHDFNNILMAITGNAEMALYKIPELSPVRSRLEGILKAGSRAKHLVQQILTFSRHKKEKKVPLQISLIIKEALNLLRASLPTTIEIRKDISAKTARVLADPTNVHQILMNLCTNAAQAMEAKGGLLKVELTDVDLDPEAVAHYPDLSPGPYVVLTVSDTGQGIDHSTMERIFDPFFTTKGPGKGTGLGLAVVHGIVKDCGGAINVTSELRKGTIFRVYLPRLDEAATTKAETSASIPTGDEQVLLIDDEKAIVDTTQDMLEYLGYRVVSKTNAIEALDVFRVDSRRFDVVITDHTMPNMTGEELAKEFLRIRPDIPIILCTGFLDARLSEKARADGIRELIKKPFAMRKLAETIRNVLDG